MKMPLLSYANNNPTWNGRKMALLILCSLISAGLFLLDFVSGPVIHVHFFYLLLVMFVAWLIGPKSAYTFAVVLPLTRIASHYLWATPWSLTETSVNILIQIIVLSVAAYLILRIKTLVGEIKTLKGNLSVCSYCTKIYNEHREWEELESYISRQAEVRFSHGICPECRDKQFGPMLDRRNILTSSS